jgi:hypothetical protein
VVVPRERPWRALRAFVARFGFSSTLSVVVRSWIFGASVFVGSRERYVPATASGANSRTATTAYFTDPIVAGDFEPKIRPR